MAAEGITAIVYRKIRHPGFESHVIELKPRDDTAILAVTDHRGGGRRKNPSQKVRSATLELAAWDDALGIVADGDLLHWEYQANRNTVMSSGGIELTIRRADGDDFEAKWLDGTLTKECHERMAPLLTHLRALEEKCLPGRG